jgi:drug/metabolite transporter (DMT)-like permease
LSIAKRKENDAMNASRWLSGTTGMVITAMLATFLWGSAFPFIKLSYHMLAIAPHQTDRQILFAGYRFFLAALMIFVVMKLLRYPVRYRKQTLIPCLRIALFQTFLQYVCFYVGLTYTTGIHASILAGTGSFFQILFAHWMYPDDKIDWRKTAGLITGFSGVWLANLSHGALSFSLGIGSLLVLASAMSGSFGNLLARNETHRMGVFYLTAWQMLIGSIGLIAVGTVRTGLFPFHFDPRSLLILLYLAFVSATGFLLWNSVMKVHPVGKVSLFLFLIPLFGSLLSSVLLHESFSPYTLAGLLLVTGGIVIVNRSPARTQKGETGCPAESN